MRLPVRILASLLLALTVSCSVDYGFHKDLRTIIEQGISSDADLGLLLVSGGAMSPYFNPREYSYMVNTAADDLVSLTLSEGSPGQKLAYSTDGGLTYVSLTTGYPSDFINITTVNDYTLVIRVTNAAATNHRVYYVRLNRTRLVMFRERRDNSDIYDIATMLYVPYGSELSFSEPTRTWINDGITTLFDDWAEYESGAGARYAVGDPGPIVTTQLNYYAQWKIVGGTGPAGGIVVYDKTNYSDGWRYIEAARPVAGYEPIVEVWSFDSIYHTTFDAEGYGIWNTLRIIAEETGTTCAGMANDFVRNGFEDWFLPSADEFTHVAYVVSDLSPAEFYWTSSNERSGYAWAISSGINDATFKSESHPARPCRMFRDARRTFVVYYDANGATSGTAPTDSDVYPSGTAVSLLGQASMMYPGKVFTGWSYAKDGSTGIIAGGSSINPTEPVILYAQWVNE